MGHGNFKPDPRIQQALAQSHHIDAARKQMSEQVQMQRMMFVQQFLADTAQKLFVQEMLAMCASDVPFVRAAAERCNRNAMQLGIALGMVQEQPEEEQNDDAG